MSALAFFATCPKGFERLLFDELNALGVSDAHETVAGASFKGSFETALRVCLWSRFASRILLELSEFEAQSDVELYMGATGIAWENYFTQDETLAVEFNGQTEAIRNTQYGAQKVKDAVCDRFQKTAGSRPSVDRENPDVRIYCHLERRGVATVALDLSGRPLLRREIRRVTGAAPLKENLAAAMIARSGYDGGCMFDPMCGSGTLLIEAAAVATDTAPGLKRRSYGFFKLKLFDAEQWSALLNEASERSKAGIQKALENKVRIIGCDRDPRMVQEAAGNLEKAGFAEIASVREGSVEELKNPFEDHPRATVVTNPPYGKRLGNFNELISLYTMLGEGLRREFSGCRAAVISSESELLSCLRLHAERVYHLFNGELECQLRVFELREAETENSEKQERKNRAAEDFSNRLAKNLAFMRKWSKTAGTDAYRVYDADVPEYACAVDCYAGRYVISAYAQKNVSERVQKRRALDMISSVVSVTGAPGDQVVLKTREVKSGASQYEKAAEMSGEFFEVTEGNMRFRVNVRDYLDTGLFLDARIIRSRLMKAASGKDFLNLFCYTATASVAAALGGAASTTGVDMSRTYLEWGRQNLELNGCGAGTNRLIQADVLSWICQEHAERFDLIYVDPPTFSNSKRMSQSFDVRRDHVQLLSNLTRLLKDGGSVVFCTNSRGFTLAEEALAAFGFACEDISKPTLPRDFSRNERIHHCYVLSYTASKREQEPEAFFSGAAPRWQKEIGKGSGRGDDALEQFERETSGNSGREGRRGFARRDKDGFGDRKDRVYRRRDDEPQPRGPQTNAEGQLTLKSRGGKNFRRDERRGFYGRDGERYERRDGRFERRDERERRPQGRVWGPDGVKDL